MTLQDFHELLPMPLGMVCHARWYCLLCHLVWLAMPGCIVCHSKLFTVSCIVVQGMAFVAGVILMYLPEEPAFRVLCQLLDGSGQLTKQGL